MVTILCLPLIGTALAQSEDLTLEWEQHWETYGVGGTCNFGTHNFYIGDVDGDGVMELITGGYSYSQPDYNWSDVQAPLRIWNWDGTAFHNEVDHYYQGMIGSIYAGDADGDGTTEIITAGFGGTTSGSYSSLKIWNWNGETLTSLAEYAGMSAGSIYISDINNDNTPEILVVGRAYVREESVNQLSVLRWDGTSQTVDLVTYAIIRANSVYACDLNNDGTVEIITGGYKNNITESSGQICVWNFNQDTLTLQDSTEWKTVEDGYGVGISGVAMGNTMVSSIKVGDVDQDGTQEIVAGGFTYDGENVNAQLTIWNWDTQTLTLEVSQDWRSLDITEVKAVSLNDVDGDKKLDIVISGFIGVYEGFGDENKPPEQAQLRVWSWDGESLLLKIGKDWTIGEGVTAWNVGTGDIDNDGTVEMVTVGCMYITNLCDPDLRIWSMPQVAEPFPSYLLVVLGVAVAAIVVVAVLLIKHRKK
ncbi:MAG: VCBS repeat-containing protein [Candidatus Bathyarchaeia archaeon]